MDFAFSPEQEIDGVKELVLDGQLFGSQGWNRARMADLVLGPVQGRTVRRPRASRAAPA